MRVVRRRGDAEENWGSREGAKARRDGPPGGGPFLMRGWSARWARSGKGWAWIFILPNWGAMTPREFIAKWRGVELKERSASQTHFNDLCACSASRTRSTADPQGDWFTFEKGASKTSGGEGWADVWRKGCFGWEYKGRHADLDPAFASSSTTPSRWRTRRSSSSSDMDRILVRTNWTNTVQETHTLTLDDLLDAAKRDLLEAAFTDPERLRPKKTRDALTAEAARRVRRPRAAPARARPRAQTVAHFVNRLVFCMFAEDVGLLPEQLFQRMLEARARRPAEFAGHAAHAVRAR